MKTARHILSSICIIGLIMILLFWLYVGIYNYSEDKCWQDLGTLAQQITKGIAAEFEDDVAKLHIMEEVLKNDNLCKDDCIDVLYLDTVLPTTMFARIDIWYPDGTVISSGSRKEMNPQYSFFEVASKGEYMSTRKTDPQTEHESIYYVMPIEEADEVLAILIGVIDLTEIAEKFSTDIYEGEGRIGVIDSRDGSFIIDSWHEELENAYEMGHRKRAEGYEDIDLREQMQNMKTGVIVFESQTTGKLLYMYYTPVNVFDWQFVIFAQENMIFEYLFMLSKKIIIFGVCVIILLLLYFVWNINSVRLLNNKVSELEEKRKLLEKLSYKDTLTSIFNRAKYVELCDSFKDKKLEKTGMAYFDLNGLKQINDYKSHDEGDKYIKNAAVIISETFSEKMYRIGGDEFVALEVGIEQDEFERKIENIKN